MGRNGAFSLIELLAVIVIVSLLAALLFPTVRGWIDRAEVVKCLSQLRTIGQATMSYASDNGAFPALDAPPPDPAVASQFGQAGNDKLMMAVYPYVQNVKVFQCPTVSKKTVEPDFKNGRYVSTYNQNVYTFAAKVGSLPPAASMILIYEGYPFMKINGTPPNHQLMGSPISSTMAYHPSKHPTIKSQNVLMMDGHAESGLQYFGWGDPKNTIPGDDGIWGGSQYYFNK